MVPAELRGTLHPRKKAVHLPKVGFTFLFHRAGRETRLEPQMFLYSVVSAIMAGADRRLRRISRLRQLSGVT
jgi:hypothetical protein